MTLAEWIMSEWRIALPAILGGLATWWLLPSETPRPRLFGYLLGAIALGVLHASFPPVATDGLRAVLFYLFTAVTLGGGLLAITDHNPIYGALWFAVTTLGVCGLFLLNSAPFLSAATIIVYGGAIVVTFVFVMMLAQQSGNAIYDVRTRRGAVTSAGAFLLLGTLLFALERTAELKAYELPSVAVASLPEGESFQAETETPGDADGDLLAGAPAVGAGAMGMVPRKPLERFSLLHVPARLKPNPSSRVELEKLGSMRALGRSLFSDYLYAVELAGTVLLVATVGAIALAPRRSQGTL